MLFSGGPIFSYLETFLSECRLIGGQLDCINLRVDKIGSLES